MGPPFPLRFLPPVSCVSYGDRVGLRNTRSTFPGRKRGRGPCACVRVDKGRSGHSGNMPALRGSITGELVATKCLDLLYQITIRDPRCEHRVGAFRARERSGALGCVRGCAGPAEPPAGVSVSNKPLICCTATAKPPAAAPAQGAGSQGRPCCSRTS